MLSSLKRGTADICWHSLLLLTSSRTFSRFQQAVFVSFGTDVLGAMDYRVMPKFIPRLGSFFAVAKLILHSFVVFFARRLFYFLSSISMPSRARLNLRPSIVDARLTTTPF